ncbi:MAG: SpoIID/LytB domain-containing protein, partial [Acutalibacter sp.]
MSPQTRKRARSLLALFLALYAAFTLLPGGVYALYRAQESPPPAQEASPSPAAAQPTATAAPGFLEGRLPAATPAPQEDSFTLYDTATGETFTVTAEEFLPAALACEMDLSAPEEALKAQAVALYTFYSYQRAQHQGEAAHFACDTANWLVYVPQSALEERWGEDFPAYYETLQQAVAAVKGQRLTWEGEPICAAFFAISGGATESSANVWGQEFPYLQSVASPGDCFASGYLS